MSAEPFPRAAYISVKFAFILVAPERRVSPLPSFALLPIPTLCKVMSYPSSKVSVVESSVIDVLSNLGAEAEGMVTEPKAPVP